MKSMCTGGAVPIIAGVCSLLVGVLIGALVGTLLIHMSRRKSC